MPRFQACSPALKILVLSPTALSGVGGAERHINNLLALLREARHDVSVWSLEDAMKAGGLFGICNSYAPSIKSIFLRHKFPEKLEKFDYVLSFDLSGFACRHPGHLRVLAGSTAAFRIKALPRPSGWLARIKQTAITQAYRWLELQSSKGLGALACSQGLADDVRALGIPVVDTPCSLAVEWPRSCLQTT